MTQHKHDTGDEGDINVKWTSDPNTTDTIEWHTGAAFSITITSCTSGVSASALLGVAEVQGKLDTGNPGSYTTGDCPVQAVGKFSWQVGPPGMAKGGDHGDGERSQRGDNGGEGPGGGGPIIISKP